MVTIDIPADLNAVDQTSFVWTFLDEASAPDVVVPGAIVVTGDEVSTASRRWSEGRRHRPEKR